MIWGAPVLVSTCLTWNVIGIIFASSSFTSLAITVHIRNRLETETTAQTGGGVADRTVAAAAADATGVLVVLGEDVAVGQGG